MRKENKAKEQVIDELIDELAELRQGVVELEVSGAEHEHLGEQRGMRIGEVLIEMGYIQRSQLEEALRRQEELDALGHEHKRLGQILVESGDINSEQLKFAIEEQMITSRVLLIEETFRELEQKVENEPKKTRDHTQVLRSFYLGEICDLTDANVTYTDMPEEIVVQISQRGITGVDNIPAVLFNVRLSDADYHRVLQEKITIAHSDIVAEAEKLGLDIASLLLIYLFNAIKYGHLDPTAGPVELSVSDWEGWAGECMWREVYADVQEHVSYKRKMGKHQEHLDQ